jgi:hypothetical protein
VRDGSIERPSASQGAISSPAPTLRYKQLVAGPVQDQCIRGDKALDQPMDTLNEPCSWPSLLATSCL